VAGVLQGSLLTAGEPALDAAARIERIRLSDEAWIDITRDLLHGADDVFALLAGTVEWKQGRRKMWDHYYDDPRLSRWYRREDGDPHPALAATRAHIEHHYRVPLRGVGLNYYRDGRDSVAPHSDRELRELDDTIVAILTLGGRRPFLVRPKGGGRSIDLSPGSGDLLVMGGACQRDFEHGIPKVARCDPRISASWRWAKGVDRPGII
jgi:alkylated DNA repair dioxygenase AlkB